MPNQDKLKLLKQIRRSFSVFRIDCGSCNGCEIEIFAAISPLWDPERFGFKLVANPRHADILLVTGPVTRQMYYTLLRAYEATPEPKIVVAFGACGISGGIFHDSYAVWGGVEKVIPVDVYIPGCPPHPASIIYGLANALGLVEQKLKNQKFQNQDLLPNLIQTSLIGDLSFEKDLMNKARFLMSYVFADELFNKFISALQLSQNPKDPNLAKQSVLQAINQEEDPRFKECIARLFNEIYTKYFDIEQINLDLIKWK